MKLPEFQKQYLHSILKLHSCIGLTCTNFIITYVSLSGRLANRVRSAWGHLSLWNTGLPFCVLDPCRGPAGHCYCASGHFGAWWRSLRLSGLSPAWRGPRKLSMADFCSWNNKCCASSHAPAGQVDLAQGSRHGRATGGGGALVSPCLRHHRRRPAWLSGLVPKSPKHALPDS